MSDTTEFSLLEYMYEQVLATPDVEAFLTELAHISAETLSKASEILCGVTLLRDRRAATVASSSERAQKMDEVQYHYNEGPCLSAAKDLTVIYVPDLATEARWPDYVKAISGHGIRSVLAIPIPLEGTTRAALNLYSSQPDGFNATALLLAQDHAQQMSRAMRLAVHVSQITTTAKNLKLAMESRTTIDVAIGIIMGQNRCDQDTAAQILKKASSNRETKLRDLAAHIVATTTVTPIKTHFET